MRRGLFSILLLTTAACTTQLPPDLEISKHFREIASPTAPGSAEPRLAAGRDGRLYLSWIEPAGDGHALRFSIWGEERWSAARTIARGNDWFVNWADFPSMAATADGTLAAHWLQKSGAGTFAYDVMLSVSGDGGQNWSAAVRPHADGTETEHGFATLVAQPDGAFTVVWLDGRNTGGDERGAMTLRATTLLPDGSVAADRSIDESVCDCCPTDAVDAGDGAIVAVYRDRSAGEVRDIWFTRLADDEWSEPGPVHDDAWITAGCPVNGPALARANDRIAAAWFTMSDSGDGIVRLAFSDDGGLSFGTPVRVDDGTPVGRVDVAVLEDGAALVSWLEHRGTGATLQVRRIGPHGKPGPSRIVATTSVGRSSGFPKMTRHDGSTFFAWTDAGEPSRVRLGMLAGETELDSAR